MKLSFDDLKEAFVNADDDDELPEGTRVKIKPQYGGGMGNVVSHSPSGEFILVSTDRGNKYFHRSDLMIRM